MTALLVLLLSTAVASAQPRDQRPAPVAPTARLAGMVIEDGSTPARPVRRAIVTVTGTNIAAPLQVVTTDDGRFVIDGLSAGRYVLTAEKAAYVKSYYGSPRITRPPGMSVAVADGQAIANLEIRMVRGAAIAGVVREMTGLPLAGAQVQASLVSVVNGQRKTSSATAGARLVVTNDIGEYRLWGLAPGEYIVRTVGGGAAVAGTARVLSDAEIAAANRELNTVASPGEKAAPPPPRPQLARLPSYFPGVLDPAEAQTVTVAAGDDRQGIDIVSRVGSVARVTGNAIGPDGRPVTNMLVGIANVSTNSIYSSPGIIRPNAAGEFSMAGLTPGRWLLFGRGAEPGVPSDGKMPWWTETEFVLGDQNLTGLALPFTNGSTVTGKLQFDGAAAPPDLSRLRIGLSYIPRVADVQAFLPAVTPSADGTFTFDGVPPGRYRATITASGDWSLRSALADGRDILDTPLEVASGRDVALTLTMTDRTTEISGVLLDQLGRPAPEYSVIVFSADPAMWATSPRRNSGIVKLGSDGRYRIAALPPGDYVLCVITDLEPAQLNDAATLEQLARAGIKLTLAEGEKKVQDFKIGG